jgi:hypothetical protein
VRGVVSPALLTINSTGQLPNLEPTRRDFQSHCDLASKATSAMIVGSCCWLFLTQLITGISGDQNLKQQVHNLLTNPHEIQLLYSEHVHRRSSDLNNLLNKIHEETMQGGSNPTAKRHILTVLTDDQGWNDIGYNDPTFVTPTLDFFASRGVKFDNFYVHVRQLSSPLHLFDHPLEYLHPNSCFPSHWFICFTNRTPGIASQLISLS